MPFGADARGRLAVVPAFVLVIPLQCSLVAPLRDADAIVPFAAARSHDEPAVTAPSVSPRETERLAPSAASPKHEEPAARIAGALPRSAPAAPMLTLPDELVVKAMDAGQQAFLRCWAHAQRSDTPPSETKVRLHLELDHDGRVTAVRTDSDSQVLERCLGVVARRLPFPAPGRAGAIELPLMFQ